MGEDPCCCGTRRSEDKQDLDGIWSQLKPLLAVPVAMPAQHLIPVPLLLVEPGYSALLCTSQHSAVLRRHCQESAL